MPAAAIISIYLQILPQPREDCQAGAQRSRAKKKERITSQKTGVCKTLCPQHLLVPKYGRICSVVISHKKKWTLLKRLTCNLHIIPYQLTKFQAPSSNSF